MNTESPIAPLGVRNALLSCSTPAMARSWNAGLTSAETVEACVPAGWKPPTGCGAL